MKNTMLRLVLSAAAAALASGCAGAWNGAEDGMSIAEEHPITVDSQVVTLTLDVAGSDLSDMDKSRIRAFADAYLVNGHGPVSVTAPAGGRSSDAQDASAAARKSLNEGGVSYEDMAGASYIPAEGAARQVILSFTSYVATPSACGVWEGIQSRGYANLRTPNFGCAMQNNLAAMIADPRDLIQPADETPADSTARVRGIKLYREGAKTSSEKDSEIKTDVSSQ